MTKAEKQTRRVPWAAVAGVAFLVMLVWYCVDGKREEPNVTRAPTSRTQTPTRLPAAQLSMPGPKASDVLAQPRAAVRAALGKSTSIDEGPHGDDKFERDPTTLTVFYEGGRAARLLVTTDEKQSTIDPAVATAWLGITTAGTDLRAGERTVKATPISVGGNIMGVEFDDTVLYEAWKKDEVDRASKNGAAQQQVDRQAYADNLDKTLVAQGANAVIRVDGTVLRIQWALCSRATITKMYDGADWAAIGAMGFTRIVCADGFGANAFLDVPK